MLLRLLISGASVWFASWIMKSVIVDPWWMAAVIAVAIGVLNLFVRPVIKAFSVSINFFTLGLFSFLLNALTVLLCSWLFEQVHISGCVFHVKSVVSAIVFSIIVSLVTTILGLITPGNK